MKLMEKIANGLVYFEGASGTMLQTMGLGPGELGETWNLRHPQKIIDLHRSYLRAGADILKTNTFGANRLKFSQIEGAEGLEAIIRAAVAHAQEARRLAGAEDGLCAAERFIALDIGPTGRLLQPLGDLDFEEAVSIFAQVVRIGVDAGVDLILLETFNDSYETKAAVLAAKEQADLPVFVTTVYDENQKLLTGADAKAMVALLEGLRVDALGINCGLGPAQMEPIVAELARYSSLPIVVNPNAGLPRVENGQTFFDVGPEAFSAQMKKLVAAGARIIGGCCGTTPAHIQKLREETAGMQPMPLSKKSFSLVSSYSHAVEIGPKPILIGERINPTGKPRLKQALREGDIDFILQEGSGQEEKGAHILDVNVGLPEIDEVAMMEAAVKSLQSVVDLPLQIDTSNTQAMERALRLYNGKAMVNSVNGKAESMAAIFPLVQKYGGVVVGLTLDEDGIPATAAGRLAIAERIYKTAADYGIEPKDIIIDPLAMSISADAGAAQAALETLEQIGRRFGGHSSLGVSNISFGLPNRDFINAAFFAMALERGLSAAIMNPYSQEMMKTYYSFCALKGLDVQCAEYIDFAVQLMPTTFAEAKPKQETDPQGEAPLVQAVVKGRREQAVALATELLQSKSALELIDGYLIPALDIVGAGFEKKTVFLPQLLMSAEAAKAAFEVVKASLQKSGQSEQKKASIILATVKGDIHDIGKNIVKVLLENYNYDVIDLGKDVPPQTIVEAARQGHVPLVGLSALMTTTVPYMQETIQLLREQAPWVKVMVGGAVLTAEYAKHIGADHYSKDAMGAVRYAESLLNQ